MRLIIPRQFVRSTRACNIEYDGFEVKGRGNVIRIFAAAKTVLVSLERPDRRFWSAMQTSV
jgi:hypothetical protein